MAASPETVSMAMFCDFENVALGVRDANYEKFDIKPVLERLLLKGSIVLKKAYCDWERYKGFKATMHEANFELIEIPHVRQSGKNSADIRMVVDALDLCYTKSHVNTFVIVSGDSDFSPLVSKLRENAKYVIGVGVKQSTSDLLIANCDEFIFYDDLVREVQRSAARRNQKASSPLAKRGGHDEGEARKKSEAIELALETLDALVAERGDTGKIWASMLKSAIKRRKPDFNEAYYGFRSFGALVEEAQSRGLLELGRDEKSGAYVSRSSASLARSEAQAPAETSGEASRVSAVATPDAVAAAASPVAKRRGRGRGKSDAPKQARTEALFEAPAPATEAPADALAAPTPTAPEPQPAVMAAAPAERRGRSRGKGATKAKPDTGAAPEAAETIEAATPVLASPPAAAAGGDVPEPPAEKKAPSRSRRPRKPKAADSTGGGDAT